MSYYFCIVGTRDNPLYQADLAPKPAGSSGPASFFSSSSSNTTAASSTSATAAQGNSAGVFAGGDAAAQGAAKAGSRSDRPASQSSTTGGVFGFGNALGAITSGFGAASRESAGMAPAIANSSTEGKGLGFGRYNDKHVLQMIAHSALDVVEDKQFHSQAMYLKAVDRMNEWTTSAFIIPGNLKFLILHEHKHDDGIRNFFFDVWELVVKVLMNPFHDLNDTIISPSFDAKVRASARKHL